MTRHVNRPVGERSHQRHVARRLMRPSALGPVVARADTDENAADALVAEVELDLLEATLDEEWRVRVGDRPHPFERHSGRGRDHERLANADVYGAFWMALEDAKLVEIALTDFGDHDRHALVVIEQVGGNPIEALTHRVGHHFSSTCATTACGRPRCSWVSARAMASWSRPSQSAVLQPSSPNRAAMPPGHPYVADRLSTTTVVSRSSPTLPAYAIASWFDPSSSAASPTRTSARPPDRSGPSSGGVRPTASGTPSPGEPLAISTPRTRFRSGWWPSGESKAPNVRSVSSSTKP